MSNRHKNNWIKGLVTVILAIVILGTIATGVIFDGRDAKVATQSQNANSTFGFDVSKLSPELRAHAEECHRKGMGAGRKTDLYGTVTAIKCYEP